MQSKARLDAMIVTDVCLWVFALSNAAIATDFSQ